MAPYRQRKQQPKRKRPESGLISDMVRQFADRYAFLRELVQNAIDAGATKVDVHLEQVGSNVVTSVMDDGSGMTRDVVEGPLLTLFSSSKEGDAGAIGKYGVGLMSVFALEPDEVSIETWTDEGAYLVRVYADHSYVLEAARPRPESGTRVAVIQSAPAETWTAHVERSRASLRAWCRHAACPIVLHVGRGQSATRDRIDTPFEIQAAASAVYIDGGEHIVVAYASGTELIDGTGASPERSGPFIGFYNRGLTLHETQAPDEPDLERLRVKVMSPALAHTLSRDNVRRDDAFEQALGRVRELARELLPRELAMRAAESAALAASGRDAPLYAAQAVAVAVELGAERVPISLWHDLEGQRVASLGSLKHQGRGREDPIIYARADSLLTKALARRGLGVVRVATARGLHEWVLGQVAQRVGCAIADATSYFALATPDPQVEAAHQAHLGRLAEMLGAGGLEVGRVRLARVEPGGAAITHGRAGLPMPAEQESAAAVSLDDLRRNAERWGASRRAVWLDLDNDAVEAWLSAASRGAQMTDVMARILLLEARRSVDQDASDRLLERAIGSGQ